MTQEKSKDKDLMPVAEERVIRARKGLIRIDFQELWRYRELFLFLAWRDVLIRYKQTAIGILWALIQPLGNVVVFTIIFGKMAGLDSNGAPYPLITLAALIPWQLFATAVGHSGNSVVSAGAMISKIYFPRLIIPLSASISCLIDALISFVMLLLVLAGYVILGRAGYIEVAPFVGFHPHFLLFPLFFFLALMTALAVGLWLSALNVMYRDVKYVIPYLVRIGMLVSPVGYLTTVVSPEYKLLYSLNPMVGVIDGFRWCILGPGFEPYWLGLWLSCGITSVVFISGLIFFRSLEKGFADVI